MSKNSKNYRKKELKISAIEKTGERLTGRAGLALFVAYMHSIGIFPLLERFFGSIRKSRKGFDIFELFKQVLCFMTDGTSRHLSYFDQLVQDAGYAGTIECDPEKMASSHQIKRFFNVFAWTRIFLFRRLLQTLSIWRFKIHQPDSSSLALTPWSLTTMMPNVAMGLSRHIKRKRAFSHCR